MEDIKIKVLKNLRCNLDRICEQGGVTNKNSKGEIRTLDLTGMSRALSPTELPCHKHFYYYMLKKKLQYLSKK